MAKEKKFQALIRLISEFKPYWKALTLIFFWGMVVSLIQPLCVKLTEQVIDSLQTGVRNEFFLQIPFFIIGAFIISGVAKYFHNTIRRSLSEKVVCKLRDRLFQRFVYMPLKNVQKKRTGEFLSSIQNDLVQIGIGIDTLCDLLKEPITFLGLMAVAFYCDWRLALTTLVVAPIAALFFSKTGAAVKRYSERTLSNFSDLVSLSQESIVGAQVVKVFKLEGPLLGKFRKIQDVYYRTLKKSIRVQELATPSVEFIGSLLMAGVLTYGAYRISIGELTSGKLIAFIIAIGLSQMPIKKLNNTYLKLRIAEAAAERVFAHIDSSTPTLDNPTDFRVPEFQSQIEFRDVSLDYGEKTALHGVSFTVQRGQRVAFVGPSGSGKTSIVNLLPRLYEVSSGSVLFDGRDTREFSLSSLRSLISVVNQETFLFHDTIYENIRYGNPAATEEQVKEAAKLANCDLFIDRLPQGYQSIVGDRGSRLSGGERQRIAIARSILKGAPILILDEATSNLDSESEAIVQSALERLMKDKTTFMVAHRLSTVQRADQIFVVQNGQIEEKGTHVALLEREGTYRRLFERQSLV